MDKPRKFRVSISEIVVEQGRQIHKRGSAIAKTIDLDDTKPIYDLLNKAKTYSEKYGQASKRTGKLVL